MKPPETTLSALLAKTGTVILSITAGTLTAIMILELGLTLLGHLSLPNPSHTASTADKSGCTIVCLGDSMTMQMYPPELEHELNRRFPDKGFRVIDKGLSSTDSDYIVKIIDETLDRYDPDIVIVMTGINDTRDKELYGHNTIKEIAWYKRLHTYRLLMFLKNDLLRKNTRKIISGQTENHEPEDEEQPDTKTQERIKETEQRIEELTAEKDFIKAQQTFETARAQSPEIFDTGHYHEYICRKVISYQKNNTGNMVSFIEDFLKRHPQQALNTQSLWAYDMLTSCYINTDNPLKAQEILLDAVSRNPELGEYMARPLVRAYIAGGDYEKAEQVMRRNKTQKTELLQHILFNYLSRNEHDKIEHLLSTGLDTDSQDKQNWITRTMALNMLQGKRKEEADRLFELAERFSLNNIPDMTVQNYRYIAGAVLKRGKTLVCMQYPVRSIAALEKILGPYTQKTLLVDNEQSFKAAIMNEDIGKLFRDIFAGDFGHPRARGIKIITDNLLSVLLEGPLKHYLNDKE